MQYELLDPLVIHSFFIINSNGVSDNYVHTPQQTNQASIGRHTCLFGKSLAERAYLLACLVVREAMFGIFINIWCYIEVLAFLVLSFWRLLDALGIAIIILYPVLYTVLAGELLIIDIAVTAVAVATPGVVIGVSGAGPGAYKLEGSEQLTANSAALWL